MSDIEQDDIVFVTRDTQGNPVALRVGDADIQEDDVVVTVRDVEGNLVSLPVSTDIKEDDIVFIARDANGNPVAVKFESVGYDCWHCFCGCCSGDDVDGIYYGPQGPQGYFLGFQGPQGIDCDDTYCAELYHWKPTEFGTGVSKITVEITGLGGDFEIFNGNQTLPFDYGQHRLYTWQYDGDNFDTCQTAAYVRCEFAANYDDYGDKIALSTENEGSTGNRLEAWYFTYVPTNYTGDTMWWYATDSDDFYQEAWHRLQISMYMQGTVRELTEGAVPWCPDGPQGPQGPQGSLNCLTFQDCKDNLCRPPQDYIPEAPTIPDDFASWNATYGYGYFNILTSGKYQECYSEDDSLYQVPRWDFIYEPVSMSLEPVAHSEMPPYFIFPRYNAYATDPVTGDPHSLHKFGLIRPTQYTDPDDGDNKSPVWNYMALSGWNGFYQDGIAKIFSDNGWNGGSNPSHFDYYDGVHPDFKDVVMTVKTCNGTFEIPLNTITREYIILCYEQGSLFGRSGDFYYDINEARGLHNGVGYKGYRGLQEGSMYAEVQYDINMYFCGIYYAVQRLNGWEIWKLCECADEGYSSCSSFPHNPTSGSLWDHYPGIPYAYLWLQDARNIADASGNGIAVNDYITEVRHDWGSTIGDNTAHGWKWPNGSAGWEWTKCIRINKSEDLDDLFRDHTTETAVGGALTTCVEGS